MKTKLILFMIVILLFSGCSAAGASTSAFTPEASSSVKKVLKLPEPRLKSTVSLEESLQQRRSIREFSAEPLSLEDISQLLWSAQGITSVNGFRTAPSAGGLYPLEVYLLAGKVNKLSPGLYHYLPEGHEIALVKDQDLGVELSQAALGQAPVKEAAVVLVITAFFTRTTSKYGDRGNGYVYMEAGHAAQNLCLQAAALDLGAVTIGAFEDNRVKSLLGLAEDESPLYIIPAGHKK